MKRILVALVAALAAWLVPGGPADAAAPVMTPASVSYNYDSLGHQPADVCTTTERGPPAGYDGHTPDDTVDRWSHGASTRQDTTSLDFTYTYDDPTPNAQVVRGTGAAVTSAETIDGDLSLVKQSVVAAKTVDNILPTPQVGRCQGW